MEGITCYFVLKNIKRQRQHVLFLGMAVLNKQTGLLGFSLFVVHEAGN